MNGRNGKIINFDFQGETAIIDCGFQGDSTGMAISDKNTFLWQISNGWRFMEYPFSPILSDSDNRLCV